MGIISAYNWYTNFRPSNLRFAPGERPWPRNQQECTSNRAFISHDVSGSVNAGTGALIEISYDASHGSRGDVYNGVVVSELAGAKTLDNPVGYSDGHVEYNKKMNMKVRAWLSSGWGFIY